MRQAVDRAVELIESLIGEAERVSVSRANGSYPMRVLETLAGAVVAVLSVFILLVGSIFAVGSMGKYVRNKTM